MPQKPSESEEEYFARVEFEKRRELSRKRAADMAASERETLKTTHWMRCPRDGQELITVSLRGVQVDSCGTCNGIWLEAGELDELVKNDEGTVLKKLRNIVSGD